MYLFNSICMPLLQYCILKLLKVYVLNSVHTYIIFSGFVTKILLVHIIHVVKKTFLREVEENSLHLGFYLFLFQHDAQMDYYGTHLATCSSDRTVKIFDVRNGGQILVADLRG